MPTFSNAPPADGRGPSLPVRRTPDGRPLVAIVTCADLVGCNTHFYGGRTVPCEAPNCQACLDGISWRWHGYVSAVDAKTGIHFLFETTAQAAQAFVDYKAKYGTLRGCMFEAGRISARKNGRVMIRCKPNTNEAIALPEPPYIPHLLCNLWNIPATAAEESSLQWNAATLAIDAEIIAKTRAPHATTTPPRPRPPAEPSAADIAADPILAAEYGKHRSNGKKHGTPARSN